MRAREHVGRLVEDFGPYFDALALFAEFLGLHSGFKAALHLHKFAIFYLAVPHKGMVVQVAFCNRAYLAAV